MIGTESKYPSLNGVSCSLLTKNPKSLVSSSDDVIFILIATRSES